jgi:hypothetical protein
MEKGMPSKRSILLIAIVLSIVIYLLGVFSGLYANKVLEIKVGEDIGKVEENVSLLKNYIDTYALDLKNVLLLQLFIDNIEDSCKFSDLYIDNLHTQLEPFWTKLPSRLEAYERSTTEYPDEYNSLKREYTRLSLRIWLTTQNSINRCNTSDFIPILYFYSRDCEECVEQGEIFDEFKEAMLKRNKRVIVFPIDLLFEDDTVYLLKQYYEIESAPTIVINNKAFRNMVLDKSTLITLTS